MYIDNNKLVLEIVTCWDCEGTKLVTRNKLCPNWGKSTNRKHCPVCNCIGKHNHKTIGQYQTSCTTCQGIGTRQENKFDTISQECLDYIINNANYIFKGNIKAELDESNLDAKFYMDCISGHNHFTGYQDYLDHRQDEPNKLLELVKEGAKHKMQVLNYIDNDNNLLLDIEYFGYQGGIEANCKQLVRV